jgi:beta-glucanase (GH16 family)
MTARFRTALLALSLGAAAAHAAPRLVWADEFDRDGAPDPRHWTQEHGRVRNQEAQFYTTNRLENARVADGHLILTARREPCDGAEYTSASLTTQGRVAMHHGRLEVRAKIPSARGIWPAIWLLGTNIPAVGWPRCGEIDVMEYVGHQPGRVHSTIHTAAAPGSGRSKFSTGHALTDSNLCNGMHTYVLEWRTNRLDFFYDGRRVHTFARDGQPPEHWPFDRPFFLLLNVAVGGSWGGQQGIDAGAFPQSMEIDYVRMYALEGMDP